LVEGDVIVADYDGKSEELKIKVRRKKLEKKKES